jgi:hypothetical protein
MLSSVRMRLCLLLSGSVAYAALLVLLRGRPSLKADAGVFLSVAGSVLRGDRLYVGVVDNKDPLFFYAHAAALDVFGWTGPFLLDVLWIAIAAASTLLLMRAIGASWLTAAIGFVTYPLLLTGAWYVSGYSLLAALSFAPLIGWLWIRDRFVLAGALLGVGILFKVNLALVLASVPVAVLVLYPRGARVQVAKAAGGFGVVAAVAALILALRGELDGYLKNLKDNISYSHEVLRATGNTTGIPGHIKVAAGAASKPGHFAGLPVGKPLHLAVLAAAFLVAGFFAIRTLREGPAISEPASRSSAARVLAALFVCSTVTTAITLALTAAWAPHDQMLALPGLMLIVFLAAKATPAVADLRRTVAVCAAGALGIVVLGGTATSPAREGGIGHWFDTGRSETANLLERAAGSRFPGTHRITFAHLGQNDEEGAAAFLNGRFSLACPAIAQYVFTPHLESVLRCVRGERPELILVTQRFEFIAGAPPEWNQFVARGSRLLAQSYQRISTRQTANGLASVWALAGEGSKRHP